MNTQVARAYENVFACLPMYIPGAAKETSFKKLCECTDLPIRMKQKTCKLCRTYLNMCRKYFSN
jgi:hypothetical protein